MAGLHVSRLHVLPVETVPPNVAYDNNAYDTWTDAVSRYKPSDRLPVDEALDDSPGLKLLGGHNVNRTYSPAARQKWLKSNAATLALLRRGMKQIFYYSAPTGTPLFSTHVRTMATLLLVDAHAREFRHDWLGASSSALDIIDLVYRSEYEGGERGEKVAAALIPLGTEVLWRTIPHLDQAGLTAVIVRLDNAERDMISLKDMLATHQDDVHHELRRLMVSGKFGPNYYLGARHVSPMVRFRWSFAGYAKILGDYDNYYKTLIADAQSPMSELDIALNPMLGHAKKLTDACTLEDPLICGAGDRSITDAYAFWPEFYFYRHKNELNTEFVDAKARLELYKKSHGAYPDSLKALPFIDNSLVGYDPFSFEAPLFYRREGPGYLLYSIGPDLRNDGGRPIHAAVAGTAPGTPTITRYSRGDIVAGINMY